VLSWLQFKLPLAQQCIFVLATV